MHSHQAQHRVNWQTLLKKFAKDGKETTFKVNDLKGVSEQRRGTEQRKISIFLTIELGSVDRNLLRENLIALLLREGQCEQKPYKR